MLSDSLYLQGRAFNFDPFEADQRVRFASITS